MNPPEEVAVPFRKNTTTFPPPPRPQPKVLPCRDRPHRGLLRALRLLPGLPLPQARPGLPRLRARHHGAGLRAGAAGDGLAAVGWRVRMITESRLLLKAKNYVLEEFLFLAIIFKTTGFFSTFVWVFLHEFCNIFKLNWSKTWHIDRYSNDQVNKFFICHTFPYRWVMVTGIILGGIVIFSIISYLGQRLLQAQERKEAERYQVRHDQQLIFMQLIKFSRPLLGAPAFQGELKGR